MLLVYFRRVSFVSVALIGWKIAFSRALFIQNKSRLRLVGHGFACSYCWGCCYCCCGCCCVAAGLNKSIFGYIRWGFRIASEIFAIFANWNIFLMQRFALTCRAVCINLIKRTDRLTISRFFLQFQVLCPNVRQQQHTTSINFNIGKWIGEKAANFMDNQRQFSLKQVCEYAFCSCYYILCQSWRPLEINNNNNNNMLRIDIGLAMRSQTKH